MKSASAHRNQVQQYDCACVWRLRRRKPGVRMRNASAHCRIARTNQEKTVVTARSISELTGPPIRRSGGEKIVVGRPIYKELQSSVESFFPECVRCVKTSKPREILFREYGGIVCEKKSVFVKAKLIR